MKKLCLALVFAVAACGAIAQTSTPITGTKHDNPGSLWNQTAPDALADRVACKEGDLITILISEISSTSFTAQTNTAKNDSAGILKGLGPILGNLIPALNIGANSATAGSGSTSQVGAFQARMTAKIKKILPNGQFMIEGTRSITTNKDTQTFALTGIIRKEDIRPDNTILSENIADAQIKAQGKGQIADRQRRGILVRLLDWLF